MASQITVKCFPLAGAQDYQVEDFQNYLAMRTKGVYAAGDNLKVQQSDVPAMSVDILKGVAWLIAGDMAGVSFPIRTDKVLDIDPSDPINPRTDSIICGLNKTTRAGYLKVAKGPWAGAAPAPVRDATYYEIVLAHVSVPAGTTEITDDLIADKRLDNNLCGLINEGAQIVADLTTEDDAGVMSARLGRTSEGPIAERPEAPATCAWYYATDERQMYFFSKILGEWSPQ